MAILLVADQLLWDDAGAAVAEEDGAQRALWQRSGPATDLVRR